MIVLSLYRHSDRKAVIVRGILALLLILILRNIQAQETPVIETFELDHSPPSLSQWYFPAVYLTDSKILRLGLQLTYEDFNQQRNHYMRLFTSDGMDAPYLLFDALTNGLNDSLTLTFNVRVPQNAADEFGIVLAVQEGVSYEAIQWLKTPTGFTSAFVSCPFALSHIRPAVECQATQSGGAALSFDHWQTVRLERDTPTTWSITLPNSEPILLHVSSANDDLQRQIGFYLHGGPGALLDFDNVTGMSYRNQNSTKAGDEERRRQIGLLNLYLVAAMEMLQPPEDCQRFRTLSDQILNAYVTFWTEKAQEDSVETLKNSLRYYGACDPDGVSDGVLQDICGAVALLRTRGVQMESNLLTASSVIEAQCPGS